MVKRTHTLSAMLTLYIGGGLLALGLLLGIAVAEGVGWLLEQAFQDKVEALARQLATISLDALLVSDYGTLERYLWDLKTVLWDDIFGEFDTHKKMININYK